MSSKFRTPQRTTTGTLIPKDAVEQYSVDDLAEIADECLAYFNKTYDELVAETNIEDLPMTARLVVQTAESDEAYVKLAVAHLLKHHFGKKDGVLSLTSFRDWKEDQRKGWFRIVGGK